MNRLGFRSVVGLCLLTGCLLSGTQRSGAQGTFEPFVFRTGTGGALQTNQTVFTTSAGENSLNVLFGFATSETVTPGLFLDSLTISVSGASGTFYLLTSDASGVAWAPVTPGALVVPTNSMSFASSEFLVPAEGLPILAAYQVNFLLPDAWLNTPLTVHFDFFDNQNAQGSLGYGGVTVIPEPGAGLLLAAGACVLLLERRRH